MARQNRGETYPAIWAAVCRIPPGRVASYGHIASLAGFTGQPRLAGYALHSVPPGADIPWHRVLNAQGRISLVGAAGKKQRVLLEREGVVVLRNRVDLGRHGWPRQRTTKHSKHPSHGAAFCHARSPDSRKQR